MLPVYEDGRCAFHASVFTLRHITRHLFLRLRGIHIGCEFGDVSPKFFGPGQNVFARQFRVVGEHAVMQGPELALRMSGYGGLRG